MSNPTVTGNYGCLQLLKKNRDIAVASYPIDGDVLVFGRSPMCDIRLYFDTVSSLHCKLIFEERKAYLQVYSPLGMTVDDCPVMPPSSGTPATVPLSNNSRFTIAHKVFVFTYPPKDIRPALIASPRPSPEKTRRALRLSMIQTSQVFSPLRRAYAPEDQIAALKSPVKPFASNSRQEDDVVLIDGEVENAVVVEEEKDLIVLEEVDVVRAIEPASPTPTSRRARPSNVFRTPPANRSRPNFNLHKAVLLRSAQKAAVRREADELEEEEVELAVSPEREMGPRADSSSSEDEDEDSENRPIQPAAPRSPLLSGFEALRSVFMRSSTSPEKVWPEAGTMDVDNDIGKPAASVSTPLRQRPLDDENPFFTPPAATPPKAIEILERRSGAQRVKVIEPWRVSDLQPLPIVPKTSPEKPLLEEEKDDGEDAQAVVNRMKGQVNEMRRRSMAREARVSLGGLSSPARSRPSIGPSTAATPIRVTYYSGGDDMLVDIKDEPDVPTVPVAAPAPQSQSRSTSNRLYPDIPTIDFSSPRKARESAAASPLPAVATTPHLSGVRDLFRPGPAAPEMATPALKGVRGLFNLPKPPIVPSTPALEAAARLFAPKVEDVPVVAAKPKAAMLAISGSSDDVPPSDATDEEARAPKPTAKPNRARAAAMKAMATSGSSRIARPARTHTVQTSEAEDSSEVNIPAPARPTRTARTTKTTVPPVAGTATRVTRRANSQDPSSSSEGIKPAVAARTLGRKASASAASADKENDESSAQESSSAALKAATTRRRVATSKMTGVETGSSSDAASRVTRSRARK